ncbi:MAG: hypothetical protein M1820_004056 [Bogoriella megaspora]|nr:MAG: hypothetical protein M1820_004056 [Bogoriella megaspora]
MAASSSHAVEQWLPAGECSYRDLVLGSTAPTCGCNQFWVDEERRLQVLEAAGSKENSSVGQKASRAISAKANTATQDNDAIFVQLVRPTKDGRLQLVMGSPTTPPAKQRISPSVTRSTPITTATAGQPRHGQDGSSGGFDNRGCRGRTTVPTQMLSNHPPGPQFASPRLSALQRVEHSRPPSSSSFQGGISSSERRREILADWPKQGNAGLGLNFSLPGVAPSLPSTTNSGHVGELPEWARLLKEFNERSASNPSSIAEGQRASPNTAFLQRASQRRSQILPPMNTGYTFAHGVAEEQSATEVATSSNLGTPDLRAFGETLEEIKDTIEHETGQAVAGSQEHRRSPPDNPIASSLQRLIPHLSAIQDYMASMPHESVQQRLDALENNSFNQGPVDELQEKSELNAGYIMELQTRFSEQNEIINFLQSEGGRKRRRLLPSGVDAANTSFGSNSSIQSTTSSALIAAAIDRQETESRLKDVEERLSQLEGTAPPSFAQPLEVEVVFLPWSRDLKGIWYSPDDAPAQSSAYATQESEEWTQALKSNRSVLSVLNSTHSGWSSDDIHDWAASTEEWLCPRACSNNSVIYKRLRSRGFVQNIIFKSNASGEVHTALKTAFAGLANNFPCIATDDSSQQLGESPSTASYIGLRRPLIPLRKVHRSSRLRFLGPSEMVTPAVWTADFLRSSAIMHAKGGQKRLFVTNADAYLQRDNDVSTHWTWQRLRELPRTDSPEANAEAGVGEADAKEACWSYHPSYDAPPSITSSFSSVVSSHRSKADQRETPPPTSEHHSQISFNHQTTSQPLKPSSISQSQISINPRRRPAPITPLSEYPPYHRRTASAPLTEPSLPFATAPTPSTTHKRRIISFDSAPHPRVALQLSRRTSTGLSSASSFKRRRMSHSPDTERNAISAAQGFTPRRSKEPPSPFYPPNSQGVGLAGPSTAKGAASWGTQGQAYATPFSGARTGMLGDGDTEADSLVGGGREGEGEEAWEGVTEADDGSVRRGGGMAVTIEREGFDNGVRGVVDERGIHEGDDEEDEDVDVEGEEEEDINDRFEAYF